MKERKKSIKMALRRLTDSSEQKYTTTRATRYKCSKKNTKSRPMTRRIVVTKDAQSACTKRTKLNGKE